MIRIFRPNMLLFTLLLAGCGAANVLPTAPPTRAIPTLFPTAIVRTPATAQPAIASPPDSGWPSSPMNWALKNGAKFIVDYSEYLFWKLGAFGVAAFVWGFLAEVNGWKRQQEPPGTHSEGPHPAPGAAQLPAPAPPSAPPLRRP